MPRKRFAAALLVGALVVAGMSYYLNLPVPSGIDNPWTYRKFCGWNYTDILRDLRQGELYSACGFYINRDNIVEKDFVFLPKDLNHFFCGPHEERSREARSQAYLKYMFSSREYVYAYRDVIAMFTKPPTESTPESNIRSRMTKMADVKVRIYEPVKSEPGLKPALIFVHGGGFCIGSTDLYDPLTRQIAERLDERVISIEYRLGPESTHPAAFEDCLNVTKWFLLHAAEFNVDSRRVGISGDSAGASLAAAVSQYIHDDREIPDLKFQALVYPVVQLIDVHTPAMEKHKHLFGVHGGLITWWEAASFLSMYLLGKEDTELMGAVMDSSLSLKVFWKDTIHARYVDHRLIPENLKSWGKSNPKQRPQDANRKVWEIVKDAFLDPRLCPLMRHDMSGLPPAFIATCEFDGMRDNGIFYTKKLREYGVVAEWKHYPGGFHGVFGPTWPFTFDVGVQMLDDYIKFIKSHW